MKVEILYVPGCPNHRPAVDRVRDILAQEGAAADMLEVAVSDHSTAQDMEFLGSPTIRVDGQDIDPTACAMRTFGLMCRVYLDGGRSVGVPPAQLIRAAVRKAK